MALASDILRLLGDDGVQPLWQHLGTVTDAAERAQDIEVLAALCDEDPQSLTQYVNADSWEGVRDCVNVLGRIGGARVRLEVVRALLTNQQSGATTMLCDILDDEEQGVRQSALWVLAEKRDARALPKLRVMVLEAPGFRERAAVERDDFFRALGRLADEATLQEGQTHVISATEQVLQLNQRAAEFLRRELGGVSDTRRRGPEAAPGRLR